MKDFVVNYSNEKLWEDTWKQEYNYGVILAIPPEPTLSLINRLRKEYDPLSHKSCKGHISLTMPIKQPITREIQQTLRNTIKEIKRFKVNYGPIINFLPVASGVVFKVEEQELFENLYKRIESTPGLEFYPRKWPFKAHLTIAEFISNEETISLTNRLNEQLSSEDLYGEFHLEFVTYMVPDQDFVFQEVANYELGH